jgi:competence protein ComEC
LNYSLRLILASGIIFAYTFLSGLSPSALRAALMFVAWAIAFFLRRQGNGLNILGFAGLVSFVVNPLVLFDIGFQLSYLSVLALIIFSKFFTVVREEIFLLNEFNQLFDMSLWVGLFILPIVSFYFGRVYLAAFLYNIVLIPFCNAILLMVFVFFFFLPFKFLILPLAALLEPLSVWFIDLNRFLGELPVSSISCRFSLWGVIFYYAVFMVALIYIRRYNKIYEKS